MELRPKLSEEESQGVCLITGFAHPELGAGIAEVVGVELAGTDDKIHPNGEIHTRYADSIRGKHVFAIQTHNRSETTNVNDAIFEHGLCLDGASTSSAKEITAVAPLLGYMRQDRKSRGREGAGARMIIKFLKNNGADRIVSVDIHSSQSSLLFDNNAFDHLTGQGLLRAAMVEELEGQNHDDFLVIAPDSGAAKMANRHRRELHTGVLLLDKSRGRDDSQELDRDEYVPEAEGRICLIFDDMIDTAGTLVTAVEALHHSGAKAIYAAATHAIMSDPAIERLKEAPLAKLIVTDTVPTDIAQKELGDKLRVIGIAETIGQAILRIIRDESISEMFEEENYI